MLYFTPGPSQLNPNINLYWQEFLELQLGEINHRSPAFHQLYQETEKAVLQLLGLSNDYRVFFTGSATEIYEKSLLGLSYSKSHHFINGAFSNRWYEFSRKLEFNSSFDRVEYGRGFDYEQTAMPEDADMLCFVHNETSTGILWDTEVLKKVAKENEDKILAIDIVSSMPYQDIDLNLFCTSFFSVQKALGLPAGLGVWMVHKEAEMRAKDVASRKEVGAHHRLLDFFHYREYWETPVTPNILGIFLMKKVIEEMNATGLESMRKLANANETMMLKTIENCPYLQLASPNLKEKNCMLFVCDVVDTTSDEIIAKLKNHDIQIGKGYREIEKDQVRIAIFPSHSEEEVGYLCKNISNL